MAIEGSCAPRFDRVSEEFERNFTERDELGASLCVMVDGEIVVDLWGGVADAGSGKPWDRDTVQVICSATKGATALCGNMLIDRGQLNPDKPVADYWPEFERTAKTRFWSVKSSATNRAYITGRATSRRGGVRVVTRRAGARRHRAVLAPGH